MKKMHCFSFKESDVILLLEATIPAVGVLITIIVTMVFSIRLNKSHSHHGTSSHETIMLDSVASDRPLIPDLGLSHHSKVDIHKHTHIHTCTYYISILLHIDACTLTITHTYLSCLGWYIC